MRIEKLNTLCIKNGDAQINDSTEVIIECIDGEIIKGLFKRCTDDGIWIEVGIDEKEAVYINYNEIKSFQQLVNNSRSN